MHPLQPEVPLQVGLQEGAIIPPDAPSTWIGMSSPVRAWKSSSACGDLLDRLVDAR